MGWEGKKRSRFRRPVAPVYSREQGSATLKQTPDCCCRLVCSWFCGTQAGGATSVVSYIQIYNSEREHHRARGPPRPGVGAFLHEAVNDDAVAVDRGVLVVQGVDERLAQIEQALRCLVNNVSSVWRNPERQNK